jgi:diguanylate cyclase (GGDEF)-like protein
MEISLFYGDERALTTIQNKEGIRMTGTKAQSETAHWVLENGKEYFSQNVKIDGVDYFGYYIPIYNTDKTVVGMAFAGKKHADVMNSLLSYILRAVGIAVLVIIVTLLCCIVASQHIITAFDSIMEYLGRLANGDFTMKMPTSVLKRQDEIGDMGHYAYMVGVSLKDVITTDPLTGLLNRRASKNYLEKWINSSTEQNKDIITVGIGDIDFFKKINDTYGHDGGDVVLREVSAIFQKHMEDEGIAARWGGEEFLLVFQCPLSEARQELQDILEEIRGFDFEYEGKHFSITLTFGLNGSIIGNDYDEIIKAADACLYKGKESGRNRIITTEGQVILPGQECREVPIAEQKTETAKESEARTAQSTAPALE